MQCDWMYKEIKDIPGGLAGFLDDTVDTLPVLLGKCVVGMTGFQMEMICMIAGEHVQG